MPTDTQGTLDILGRAVEAKLGLQGFKRHGFEVRFRCPNARAHAHGDKNPAADYNVRDRVWKCHACGAGGGLLAGEWGLAKLLGLADGGPVVMTDAERAQIDAERAARRAAEAEDRARGDALLAAFQAAEASRLEHAAMSEALDYLAARGISEPVSRYFGMHGGSWYGTPALVMPWTVRGEIRAVQYRLLQDIGGGRFRWHEGSHPTLYNADAVLDPHDSAVAIVEGAAKAAALYAHGVTSVCAVTNKTGWKVEYAKPFGSFERVYVVLDPDARAEAVEVARSIGKRARVVDLPGKPDDCLVRWRGDVDRLAAYMEQGRGVTE